MNIQRRNFLKSAGAAAILPSFSLFNPNRELSLDSNSPQVSIKRKHKSLLEQYLDDDIMQKEFRWRLKKVDKYFGFHGPILEIKSHFQRATFCRKTFEIIIPKYWFQKSEQSDNLYRVFLFGSMDKNHKLTYNISSFLYKWPYQRWEYKLKRIKRIYTSDEMILRFSFFFNGYTKGVFL